MCDQYHPTGGVSIRLFVEVYLSRCVSSRVSEEHFHATTPLHAISNRMKIVEYPSTVYLFYLAVCNACSMNNNEKRFTNRGETMAYVRTIHLEIRAVVGRALCEISPDG